MDPELAKMYARIAMIEAIADQTHSAGFAVIFRAFSQYMRGKEPMPLKYDPDTGIPSYVPDLGEELEEGVTPKPTKLTSKSEVFAGDRKAHMLAAEEGVSVYKPAPKKGRKAKAEIEHQGVVAMGTPDPNSKTPLADAINAGVDISKEVNERFDEIAAGANPAALDKDVATDEEVDNLEKLARAGSVLHWPELLRLINRLRLAEAK
jgi:hypothetical protein